MNITKIRNITANTIDSLGLNANETKVIFYNRPFWLLETEIRAQMFSNNIVLLDDENNIVCRKNPNYIDHTTYAFDGEELMGNYFLKFGINWSNNDEDIVDLEEEAGRIIIKLMRGHFRKLMNNGSLIGYSKTLFETATNGIVSNLKNGNFSEASIKFNSIGTDAFFNNARKNRFKNLCDSINLT